MAQKEPIDNILHAAASGIKNAYNKTMDEENKNLLLKDLCARLPYGVKFLRESWNYEWDQEMSVIEVLEDVDKDGYINNAKVYNVEDIKPFLRPMSSMTDEEHEEYRKYVKEVNGFTYNINCSDLIDWFNRKMFDYRGLIPKGLALEAKDGMYIKAYKD